MTRARGGPYEYRIPPDEERRLDQFLEREGPDDELFVASGDVIARAMGISPGTAKSWLSGNNKKGVKTLPPGVDRDEDRRPGMPLVGTITRHLLAHPAEQREAIDSEAYREDLLRRNSAKRSQAGPNVTPLPTGQTA